VEGDAPVDPALAAPVDPATLSPYIMNKIPSAFFIAADPIGKDLTHSLTHSLPYLLTNLLTCRWTYVR
jgi:hypothetical protein